MTNYYRGLSEFKDSDPFNVFVDRINRVNKSSILEVGVARSMPDRPTHHQRYFSNYSEYIKSDFVDDKIDVDVVADIHNLEDTFGLSKFDGVVARSVYEHVEKPWLASASINGVLKEGGLVHIDTHLTFPIHGYPNDYFRFTTDGLVSLFDESFGFETLCCDYAIPCTISFTGKQKQIEVWDTYAAENKNFLNVSLTARKIHDLT